MERKPHIIMFLPIVYIRNEIEYIHFEMTKTEMQIKFRDNCMKFVIVNTAVLILLQ